MQVTMTPFRDDELIAKCSPRGHDNGGMVCWSGHYASYNPPAGPDFPKDTIKKRAMTYVMEHHMSRKNFYRTIEGICITNLYCGVGHGWDAVLFGDIVQHFGTKTDAQRTAELLLDGKC
jgi:hypothetical protein